MTDKEEDIPKGASSLLAVFQSPLQQALSSSSEEGEDIIELQEARNQSTTSLGRLVRRHADNRYSVEDTFDDIRRLIPSSELLKDDEHAIDVNEDSRIRSNLSLYELDGSHRYATSTYLSSHSWDPSHLLTAKFGVSDIPHPPSVPKLKTIQGVFLPVLQNIFGVILFVRVPWIIGLAGIGYTLLFLVMSIACTTLTTISMAAIATNGVVPAGGAYYMISRSLGKDLGVAVGLLLYLTTAVSSSIYVLGAVEVLVDYIAPPLGSFIHERANQGRLYGTFILLLLFSISLLGMKVMSKVSLVFLAGVVIALLSCFVGLFASNRPGLPPDAVIGFPGDFSGNFPLGLDEPDMNGSIAKDITLISLFALFFPGVTGIMAGSNKSASLEEPGRSLPIGTLNAILVSGIVYFIYIMFFGTVCTGEFLRTKRPSYGLHIQVIGWPHGLITLIGAFLSCIGAAIQSISGAPKLIQAIAKDDIFPWLSFFKVTYNGEPQRAVLLTYAICQLAVLAGTLDAIAPITSLLFLISYASINASTAILSILKYPNWRPKWKYYHWSLSLIGLVACLVYMFIINWIFALVSIVVFFGLFKYVEYRGAQVEWGDGLSALNIHMAQKNLLAVESQRRTFTARNWRPQIMCFLDLDEYYSPKNREVLLFLSQLRKAGGLSIVTSVVSGDLTQPNTLAKQREVYDTLSILMKQHKIEGFPLALQSDTPFETSLTCLQSVGLGVLRPNTVLMAYPKNWRNNTRKDRDRFVQLLKSIMNIEHVVMLLKSDDSVPFPETAQLTAEDTIDVYWIMHDGGVLTLLPYLLKKHRVWRTCRLRIYCLAQLQDNSLQMKADLEAFLNRFRIEAEAYVLEISDYDVSEFTYEKTMKMQRRNELLQQMNVDTSQVLLPPVHELPKKKKSPQSTKPDFKQKVEFMNTSVKLNSVIKQNSLNAAMIFCNLPAPTRKQSSSDYLEYLDVLTSDLPRFALVKGSGMEVVTTFV